MRLTKQLTALVLALLMAIAAPLAAFAEADSGFELTTIQTKFYAGLSYDVTATISNATAAEATGHDCFEWSVSATDGEAAIAPLDNYKYTDNGNGTYTVVETASVTMPKAGAKASITAKLGTRSQTLQLDSLQPIESFDVDFLNSEHAYLDTNFATSVLYLDRKASAVSTEEYATFTVKNVSPGANDDEILLAIGGIVNSKYTLKQPTSDSYELSVNNDVSGTGTINFSVLSGGKAFKNYNVQICIPATAYDLDVKGFKQTGFSNYGKTGGGPYTLTNLYTGKTFGIRASGDRIGNDDIKFELYTDEALTTKAPATYCQAKNNRECELNITEQGTYWLVSKNYSKDNGMLERTLEPVVTRIVVNQSISAQSINLYELDENNNKTDTKLEDITLYTNTLTTYDLTKNITILPDNRTDGLEYSSSNTAAATVSANGLITAKSEGDAIIYVKSDENANANASVNVHVRIGVKAITEIVKQDKTTIIPSGHIQKLEITTNPPVIDEPIYWSSSNRDVLNVDRFTGVITASDVTEDTIVTIKAIAETGVKSSIEITVVPANRAKSLELTAETASTTCVQKDEKPYRVYADYYQSNAAKRPSFTVTANAPGENGEQTNDEFVWTVSYNNGVGLSLEEAKADGLINYTDSTDHRIYQIVPQKQGTYAITCTATTNITATQANDPTDTVVIEILQTATTLSVKDTDTGKNAVSSIYLPIGGKKEITVKASTADNDKTIDPPTYKVTQGEEYINISQRTSDDGEGITYTVEGLSYGFEASKITFSSTSGSKSTTITFYIRNNLSNAEIRGLEDSYEFTGSAIKPEFEAYYGGSKIDTDSYTVAYKDNTNTGTATVTLTGKSEYNGSVKVFTFNITPKPFDDTITVSEISRRDLTATLRETQPAPSVRFNGRTLVKDKDYTLIYKNNNRAGTGTVIVNGIGNYSGTTSATFAITDIASFFTVSEIPKKTYTGKEICPLPVVKYNGKVLKKDVDYTVSYSNNVNSGTATVRIQGIGSFRETVSKTFTIQPKKAVIKSLKKGKKKFTVKWSKQVDISGYQVQYALDKKFKKSKKTKIISDINANSLTVSKLKKKKTYFVRIRSYKIVNGVYIYGSWSKVKSVKTK